MPARSLDRPAARMREPGPARARLWGAALALGGSVCLGACGGSPEGEPGPGSVAPVEGAPGDGKPNLLLITVDTLRADHLGCYGYFRDTAPHIDALARESIVFENCLAPIPRTTPSHLSLMTGVYPMEHGIVSNGARASDAVRRDTTFDPTARLRTIAQALRDEGYATGGFVSAAPLKRLTGLANGFEEWSEPRSRRTGSKTNVDALAWLANVREPFFMWVHYMDAHGPYTPSHPSPEYAQLFSRGSELRSHLEARQFPEEFETRAFGGEVRTDLLFDLYDGAIREADDAFGELMSAVRSRADWDRTAVVLLSDHGQGLGQHDFYGHATVWSEQLRVPLLMRIPDEQPRRVSRLLSIIDVIPSLLGLVRVDSPTGFLEQCRGVDVLAENFEERPVFSMSIRKESALSLTTPRWKFILRRGADDELYDLQRDPFELHDVRAEHPEVAQELRASLLASMKEQRENGEHYGVREAPPEEELDEAQREHLEQLRALGYADDER